MSRNVWHFNRLFGNSHAYTRCSKGHTPFSLISLTNRSVLTIVIHSFKQPIFWCSRNGTWGIYAALCLPKLTCTGFNSIVSRSNQSQKLGCCPSINCSGDPRNSGLIAGGSPTNKGFPLKRETTLFIHQPGIVCHQLQNHRASSGMSHKQS